MKVEDLPEQLVEILVGEHFEQGWEYTYWGKKITFEDKDSCMKSTLEEAVVQELETDGYDIDVNLKLKDIRHDKGDPSIYCACIYMDKHDGDSCGVVVLHMDRVKEKVDNLVKEIKNLLDWKNEN